MVQRADSDHGNPAQSAGMYVADGPVSVMGESIHSLDGHHRAFEGGHTVEGQSDYQEAQDWVCAQLMPSAGQRHHTVDHTAPGGSQQNQRHYHACSLRPGGQSTVVQVVSTGPNIESDQRPEVDDGQTVRVNRTFSLLGYEVVHHAQEASGQQEAYRVMAPPPLHHGVDRTREDGVGLGQADWDCQVVYD